MHAILGMVGIEFEECSIKQHATEFIKKKLSLV